VLKRITILYSILVIGTCPSFVFAEDFRDYLKAVREKAIIAGVPERILNKEFNGLKPDPRVLELDRNQPEFVQTLADYLDARVSKARIIKGQEMSSGFREELSRVEEYYQVDSEYILAFWGLETNYGRYQGNYSVVRSLATLGHDPRRKNFFTRELINALKILDQGHISSDQFVGAWAGAMGQSQFMPSSFLGYAQDFDRDGRKDIWNSEIDVFASIAYYLKKNGWKPGFGWGKKVIVSETILKEFPPMVSQTKCRALKYHSKKMLLNGWRDLGVNTKGLLDEQAYALLRPGAEQGHTYLVGGNFETILAYNCANKYAISVGLLADFLSSN